VLTLFVWNKFLLPPPFSDRKRLSLKSHCNFLRSLFIIANCLIPSMSSGCNFLSNPHHLIIIFIDVKRQKCPYLLLPPTMLGWGWARMAAWHDGARAGGGWQPAAECALRRQTCTMRRRACERWMASNGRSCTGRQWTGEGMARLLSSSSTRA
jgi:hypothetical protein